MTYFFLVHIFKNVFNLYDFNLFIFDRKLNEYDSILKIMFYNVSSICKDYKNTAEHFILPHEQERT